jgi:hypothetical protein
LCGIAVIFPSVEKCRFIDTDSLRKNRTEKKDKRQRYKNVKKKE